MDNQAFFKYVETRGQAGYRSAILVKTDTQDKYSLLIASVTAPTVFGSQNSFEFDLINSATIGKIQGKETLEDKEVEFLLHRDNIYRLEQLKDKILDFMYLTPDFMGWKFTGKINSRPNDATAETLMGTYTITPMSAEKTPILNARDMIMETVLFNEAIPDSIDNLTTTGTEVSCGTSPADATLSCVVYDFVNGVKQSGESANFTATVADRKVTFKQSAGAIAGEHYAIAYITASKTGYASWTTTVAVSTKK